MELHVSASMLVVFTPCKASGLENFSGSFQTGSGSNITVICRQLHRLRSVQAGRGFSRVHGIHFLCLGPVPLTHDLHEACF